MNTEIWKKFATTIKIFEWPVCPELMNIATKIIVIVAAIFIEIMMMANILFHLSILMI